MRLDRLLRTRLTVSVVTALACSLGGCGNGTDTASVSRVEGTVMLEGAPVAGARVALSAGNETITDQTGAFVFSEVPPGNLLLTASYLADLYAAKKIVQLEDGETETVSMVLTRVPDVGRTVGEVTAEEIRAASPSLTGVSIQDIVAGKGYAILCDTANGFEVVDVADPTAPRFVGGVFGDRSCEAGALDWPLWYCGWNDAEGGGVAVYALEDPAHPRKLGEAVTDNQVYGLDLSGQVVYTVGSRSFQTYRVDDPAAPALLASLPIKGEGVEVRNGYAFVATRGGPVFTVIDVADPANPQVVWRSDEEDEGVDCVLDGTYAYVAANRVYHYDVRDPLSPRLVGIVDSTELLGQGATLRVGVLQLEGLTAEAGRVYLGAVRDGLIVVDYADPHRPRFAWQTDDTVPFAMNVYVEGDYAFVAARTDGMRVVRRR
ncbi:hypothetical protein JCM30394_18270 [Deferrisoma palaeochoriense]